MVIGIPRVGMEMIEDQMIVDFPPKGWDGGGKLLLGVVKPGANLRVLG